MKIQSMAMIAVPLGLLGVSTYIALQGAQKAGFDEGYEYAHTEWSNGLNDASVIAENAADDCLEPMRNMPNAMDCARNKIGNTYWVHYIFFGRWVAYGVATHGGTGKICDSVPGPKGEFIGCSPAMRSGRY